MTLLQITETTGKLIEKGYQTTPDSIYGFLIATLLIIICVLALVVRFIYIENKRTNVEYRNKVIEIMEVNNQVTEKVSSNLEKNTIATERNNQLLQTLITKNNH